MTTTVADPTSSIKRSFSVEPDLVYLGVGAAAAAAAGLVHASAAGSHQGDAVLVWLFASIAALQVGWAIVAVVRPSRGASLAGVVINGVALLAWAGSRTVGLPVAGLREVEPIGFQDGAAAALQALAAACCLLAVARRSRRSAGLQFAWVGALGVVLLAIPAVAASHVPDSPSHGHLHEHGDNAVEVTAASGAVD